MRGNRPDGRNANRGAELIIILWRDIPAQVTARRGRAKVSVQLSDRFQIAIDKAAARAGKHTTDDYLGEWRRDVSPCDGDLSEAVEAAASELEADFGDDRLDSLVQSGGRERGSTNQNWQDDAGIRSARGEASGEGSGGPPSHVGGPNQADQGGQV